MTDFEALGRYHAALERLERAVQQRNSALNRAGLTLTAASQPPGNRHNVARVCPFDACERLLAEGRAAQREIDAVLDELAVYGPLVGKSVPAMENIR